MAREKLSTYLDRIRLHCEVLGPGAVAFNEEGLANDVVVVGDRVYRFAKSDWARACLRQEVKRRRAKGHCGLGRHRHEDGQARKRVLVQRPHLMCTSMWTCQCMHVHVQ